MNIKYFSYLSISALFFILLALTVYAQSNFVQTALEPFKHIDVEQVYNNYAGFIDLFIYFLVFMGMAKVTLGKKFEGRGGNLIVLGIGIALSVSMAVAEHYLGFNLKSFGVIAGIIFTIMIGLILFLTLKSVGLNFAGATSFSIVVIYFLLRAATPSLFKWLETNIPFIHTIILFVFIVSIWELAVHIWPKKLHSLENIRLPKTPYREKTNNDTLRIKGNLKKESEIIKGEIENIPAESYERKKELLLTLEEILNRLKTGNLPYEEKKKIVSALERIQLKDAEIRNRLKYLQNINKNLENYDFSLFSDLKTRFAKLPHYARKEIVGEIQEEKRKIKLEEEIERIVKQNEDTGMNFRQAVEKTIELLESENIEEAVSSIKTALVFEKKSRILVSRINRAEKQLYDITRREIESFEKSLL